MCSKLSIESVISIFEENNCKLLSEYKNTRSKLEYYCNKCETKLTTTLETFRKKKCKGCEATALEGINCIKCNVVLTKENKVDSRNSCKDCDRIRRRDYIQNKNNELKKILCGDCSNKKKMDDYCQVCKVNFMKKCEKCHTNKLLNKFTSINHKSCKECSPKSKNLTKEEWLTKNVDVRSKTCIECNDTKDINEFSYHTNNFRNQCKKCLLKKEYYKTYRAKKKKEDKDAFLAHNNESHKKWVENNKEHCIKYNKQYNKTLDRHVKNAISKAKNKQTITDKEYNELYDLFSKLMISDCVYCGCKSTDELYNGIDRIDSTKAYVPDNCAACCKTCNIMKNSMDLGSFLRKSCEISTHNNLNVISLNDYRLKFHKDIELTNYSTQAYKNYKDFCVLKRNIPFNLSKEEYYKLVKGNCYLCNKIKNTVGIDRVDNNCSYQLDNTCLGYPNVLISLRHKKTVTSKCQLQNDRS